VNLIATTLDAPAHSLPDAQTFARQDFLRPGSLPEPGPRARPYPTARPHRIRRKRQQPSHLSSRASVRLRATPAAAPAISDETLLAGLRAGDAAAGDALVARHAGPLLRYLQRVAGPELAEELHQQTWLSVLDHLERFQSGGTTPGATSLAGNGGGFKAWLFRIATNKANDVWRSRGRERNAKEGLKRITDTRAPHAAAPAESAEQNQALADALALLPREQREALALRFYSSMKFTEIAAVMGCPVNTALTRVHKGILKLRQIMEAE
jgi:RNA polymerase sigma-70 factor (ECF subfamily)